MTMNPQQRKILKTCGVIIGVMLLFPPFVTYLPNGAQSSEGYSFLFFPPQGGWVVKPTVNAMQLIAQWLAVALIGGIGFVLSAAHPLNENASPSAAWQIPNLSTGPWLKLMGPVLRIGRGILVLAVVFIGIALLTSMLQMCTMDPASSREMDWGKLWALLLAKVAGMVIILIANRALKVAINRIYRTHFGRTTDIVVRWRDL